ncbi:glycosyltransferase family 39 protein [Steroidobacter sp. S1-65]|uniref:Glycosyltransferase family 39 protein n=1 Tax=Steroidobacter gossypii TaxID=2805490 RepID=A0ABS1WR62_9GAMM|nr:glycosyltransferase family 39 protein [Steroidobacter gossypii]MBM0103448.1 glycosyltransferase family 39 protein [Steroidobacter gossypii]
MVYHADPPLLNLFAGVGLKLFGSRADIFFSVVFHVLGLLAAVTVYLLTLRLSGSRVAAVVATALMVFSPSFVLYENWLMYSFPAAVMLTVSAWLLYRYVETRQTKWCAAFFTVLAMLLLTRSLFHLAWMILIAVVLFACLRERRKPVLLAALVPLLVVAAWYGKNYYYFGVFSSSTWMGLGLSNISTLVATQKELQPLVADGRLTPFALVSRYRETDKLFASQLLPPSGIPVLDQVRKSNGPYNFNNRQIVDINRYYTQDAVTLIRTYPFNYVYGLVLADGLFFSPSDMNRYFSEHNRSAAAPMQRWFNPLWYGVSTAPKVVDQPHFGFNSRWTLEINTSKALIALWLLVLPYGYWQARQGVLKRPVEAKPRAIVLGFIVVTAAYLYVVGTTLELAENYRYRFLIEPLFFVLTATAVVSLVDFIKLRISHMRGHGQRNRS